MSEPTFTIHITAPGEEPCTRAELAAGVSEIRQLVASAFDLLRLMAERLDAQSRWMVAHSGRHDVIEDFAAMTHRELLAFHGGCREQLDDLAERVATLDAGQVVIGEQLDELLEQLEPEAEEEEAEAAPAGHVAIGGFIEPGTLRIFVDGRPVLPTPCSLCQRAGGEGCTYCTFYRD